MSLKTEKTRVFAYLVGGLLGSLLGCAPPPPSAEIKRTDAPIIDGTRERGREQVVVVSAGGGLCTGALVADRVVLSAKHCIQQGGAAGPLLPSQVRVGVGSAAGFSGSDIKWFSVANIVTTPGTYSEGVLGVRELSGADVSVITLVNSVAGVAPLKLKLDDPSDQEGEHATAVGFGQTPDGEVGVKYSVGTTVERVTEQTLRVDDTVCQGDSGGPLINDADEVFGVVSYGSSAGCGGGASYYQRIDLWADLILDAIDKSAVCGENGAEACDGFDNDCDGKVDEDCLEPGEKCQSDVACITRLCADTEQGKVCSTPCNPLSSEDACDKGFVCVADAECKGVCVRGEPGKLGFGETCEADTDCASHVCAESGDGASRCLVVCLGDDGRCLFEEACTASPGQCGECAPSDEVATGRGTDETCEVSSQCRSNLCFDDGDSQYCANACDSDNDCDKRHHCRDNACARGPSQTLGGRCSEHDDCAEGFCAKTDKGQFCTRVCDDDAPCDKGYVCEEVNNGWVCFPDRQLVGASCESDDDCAGGECHEKSATCTRACASPSDCGVGLECVRVNDAGGLCLSREAIAAQAGQDDADGGTTPPGDDGSCSVGNRSAREGAGLLGWLSALAGLTFVRRRRSPVRR